MHLWHRRQLTEPSLRPFTKAAVTSDSPILGLCTQAGVLLVSPLQKRSALQEQEAPSARPASRTARGRVHRAYSPDI